MKNPKKTLFLTLAGIILLGFLLRVYHIEFGLPHSFYADEPEIVEPAIKYTYEIRDVITNNNWYKLIPISYVYGTFPTYLMTFLTMGFSKFNGLLGITFDKMHIYIFLRIINSLFSLAIIPLGALLYKRLFKDNLGTIVTAILLALNWKFIVHAHYVNADIFVTALLLGSFVTMHYYYKKFDDTLLTVISGILFGLAVGTKFTSLLTLPLFLYVFLAKKEYRNMFAFCFIIFGTFAFTNPFSIIFASDFGFRIFSMMFKEAGLVFDSVDSRPLKYVYALISLSTIPVFLTSLYGIYKKIRANNTSQKHTDRVFHLFLLLQVVFYILFYSLQSRYVDRWVLPILPIILIYCAYAITIIKNSFPKLIYYKVLLVILGVCSFYPFILLKQFQRNTPKSAAYLWMQQNIDPSKNKLIYTEEGLDPMNKLPGARVIKYEVYEYEGAQYFLPENPRGYDYIVLSSRPMAHYKKPEIIEKYPWYFEKWAWFEHEILDSNRYKLVKSFELPKPNLIPLSNVYIYENTDPVIGRRIINNL